MLSSPLPPHRRANERALIFPVPAACAAAREILDREAVGAWPSRPFAPGDALSAPVGGADRGDPRDHDVCDVTRPGMPFFLPLRKPGPARARLASTCCSIPNPRPRSWRRLGAHGTVRERVGGNRCGHPADHRESIGRHPGASFVLAADPDAERREGRTVDTVSATNFADGIRTWDQDAVDVPDQLRAGRTDPHATAVASDVAVLDTGLLHVCASTLPQERIATQFAKAFNWRRRRTGQRVRNPQQMGTRHELGTAPT